MEDVNFDGAADFVTFPAHGARNSYAEFYLYTDGEYVFAPVWNGKLCNYTLDAAQKRVYCAEYDGYRNRQAWVYAWQDGRLTPLRSLSVQDVQRWRDTETGYAIEYDMHRYEIVVKDYTRDANGEIILRETYAADETDGADEARIAAAEALLREAAE